MPEKDLVAEFKEFLGDPVQQSWIQAYLDGDQGAEALVEAALRTLEESCEIEEDKNRRFSRFQRRARG